jgi:hypothetical protein
METATKRSTRSKGSSQPAQVLVEKRKRRTKAEIERDNALLEEKKRAKDEKKQGSVARVAELEDNMAVNDANSINVHPRI